MSARATLVIAITLALLLPVGLAATALGADEHPVADHRAAGPSPTAPATLAQATPAQPTEQPAQTQQQPAQTQEQPAQEPAAARFGPAWRSSSTGRQIPDPTGTNFFRPAVSGGTGVVAW
jgi:biotin carboxyl carrier protein